MTILTPLVASTGTLCAQSAWYEGFEGPQASWRDAGGSARYRVDAHQRIQGEAHTGRGCEWLRISGTMEGYVYFAHDVGHPRVIDELLPTVWVKADRSGIQLLVRVVLPRVRDPQTGVPLSPVVGGSSYTAVGRWQQLRIDGIPQRLTRQARLLQPHVNSAVDVREAYVDGILLNVYGGAGTTNVWIDDLDIAGFVESAGTVADRGPPRLEPLSPNPPFGAMAADGQPASSAPSGSEDPSGGHVKLVGSVLVVDGRPMSPRAIQYQGEPLALLKQLGFNAVWFSQQPTREILEEAGRLGLWVVCPPPLSPPSQSPAGAAAPAVIDPAVVGPAVVGPGFDRVLVWDLGSRLTGAQFDSVRQWAEQVRAADRRSGRPLICRPEGDLRLYSTSCADLLLIGRSPLGTSLDLADYGTWVRERPRLIRAGTPIWTTVQTQPARSLLDQWTVLSRGEPVPTTVANEQIRLLVYTAVTAGSRGLLFESDSPLDANDADTRSRAMTLELLNLELGLLEPWAAAGHFVATVQGSEPQVTAAVLRTERARLLVPLWSAPGAQFVSGQAAAHNVSFVVPGVPESNRAYELTPGGLKPLQPKRVTGGTRITLDEFGLTSLVVLTQDPLVVNSLTRRAAQAGPRAAELERQLAADKLRLVEQVHGRLSARSPVREAAEWIGAAKRSLQSCDGSLAVRDYAAAFLHAQRAMRPLRLLERAHWEAAVHKLPSPVMSPAAVSFRTLPWHLGLMDFIATAQPAGNQLPGGDFEDLGAMLQAGWCHYQRATPGVHSESNLAPAAAHSGGLGLRLAAHSAERGNVSILIESPPVWITSPAVQVEPGAVVGIQGWVQVPTAITGSVDGLMILDSLTGEPLAERIDETTGWKQFTLYRVAPQSGQMAVTFALSGLGEALIDDVTIQVLWPSAPGGVTRFPGMGEPLR